MEFTQAIQASLLSLAVLFLALGVFAAVSKSDLQFPVSLNTTLTIYLLTAIGFKGGVAIHEAGVGAVWLTALAAVALGGLIPFWTCRVLQKLGGFKLALAGALAAHYGSVSAAMFFAVTNFLKSIHQPYESCASAFFALMESPAIIVGIMLGKGVFGGGRFSLADPGARHARRDAVLDRRVLLLIGALSGQTAMNSVEGFFVAPFQGTIICQAFLEGRVVELLCEAGAHGHTAFNVRGSGYQGGRSADIVETGNVPIEVIMKPEVSETLLARLHAKWFASDARVAYENEVRVVRPSQILA